ERGDKAPARYAEHPQQRELRAPPDHRQRLSRENEQASSEQRHEREDVQIDAVGPRHARAGREACLGTLDGDAGGQALLEPVAKRSKIDARLKAQIDASNQTE